MIRKVALQVGALVLLVFMAWNAYLAVNHLKQMGRISALTLESSMIQADIAGVLKDLTDMETGQRGYLLTGNSAYLQPYTDAKGRIETDFAALRVGLVNKAESARSQLESLANSVHSCWWIQTKEWSTWIELARFCLRYPWRRPAASLDLTEKGRLA